MKILVATLTVLLAGGWSSGCKCAPTGPSGPGAQFAGSIAGGGLVFHDVVVPSNTDSVDVRVEWTAAEAQVRLIQIAPDCDPTQNSACERFGDPQGPRPNGSQTTITGYLNHQGRAATGRVRFVLQNLTANIDAPYTATATPKRHGCEK